MNRPSGSARVWILWAVASLIVCAFMARLIFLTTVSVASTRTGTPQDDSAPRYLSPVALAMSSHGNRLYVLCMDSDQVLVVDTAAQKVIAQVGVGRRPEGIALSPDGKSLYVSSVWDGTVAEIDTDTLHLRRTMKAGWGPADLTTDKPGRFLYVANTLGNDVSVIDLSTGREVKRLEAGHFPKYVALSKDGRHVFVSNLMVRIEPYDRPPLSQLTVVDTAKRLVSERVEIPGVIQLRHIAELPESAGGDLIIPFMRPKNLNPLIQVEQGWYMTHGMTTLW